MQSNREMMQVQSVPHHLFGTVGHGDPTAQKAMRLLNPTCLMQCYDAYEASDRVNPNELNTQLRLF